MLPILTMLATVIAGLFISGEGETVTEIIGSADSYSVLTWASLLGCFVATLLSIGQRILTLNEIDSNEIYLSIENGNEYIYDLDYHIY